MSEQGIQRNKHVIDAAGRPLGRLAAQIAVLLKGKSKPGFAPYKDIGDFVAVKNVDQMAVTGSKMEQKTYYRHSGYLGGLKAATMKEVAAKKGSFELLRRAVYGMLSKNRLRDRQIKRLSQEK